MTFVGARMPAYREAQKKSYGPPRKPTVLPRTEGTYPLQGRLSGREEQSTDAMIDSRQTCVQEARTTQA